MKNYRVMGNTMIEVLVALVIVSIVAAFAYSSYLGQIRKSRRSEGAIALTTMAQAQERFYARFRIYTSTVSGGSSCSGQGCGLGQSSTDSENDYYALSANGNATSFALTAAAQGLQYDDYECRTLTLDNTGVRGGANALGSETADICW